MAEELRANQPEPLPAPSTLPSLRHRRSPLALPVSQLALLAKVPLDGSPFQGNFSAALATAGYADFRPGPPEVLQLNLGKLCNMTCRHCHVDAGPDRTDAVMDRATAEACVALMDRLPLRTVDLTGGAPELNPHFRYLVEEARQRGLHVIDRSNLTVLLTPALEHLPWWLAERGVEVVASFPHPRRGPLESQRGAGAWQRSLEALRRLNRAGYGTGDPKRVLTLVANPVGAFLPGQQKAMEREWKALLAREHGISFDRLITITNMPISRYLEWLESSGNLQRYMELLVGSFNPQTVPGLMCRNTLSVSWDGRLFHCDFNQMLDLEVSEANGGMTVFNFDATLWQSEPIRVARHCFGCTAGSGSSCGGTLVEEG